MTLNTDLDHSLLDQGRGVVDKHDEGLRLDEPFDDLLQHDVWQGEEHGPQQLVQAAAHRGQAVLRAWPAKAQDRFPEQ